MSTTTVLRENWLNQLALACNDRFIELGHKLPSFRVSCGFTSKGNKGKRIGECWSSACSKDAHHEIFVSPILDEPLKVAGTLVHELIHAAVGLQHKHAGDFKTMALAIGLEGKMTATTEGQVFIDFITPILATLGAYPHAQLSGGKSSSPESRSGKLLRFKCPDCGYTIYVTKTWNFKCGVAPCPDCNCDLCEF